MKTLCICLLKYKCASRTYYGNYLLIIVFPYVGFNWLFILEFPKPDYFDMYTNFRTYVYELCIINSLILF